MELKRCVFDFDIRRQFDNAFHFEAVGELERGRIARPALVVVELKLFVYFHVVRIWIVFAGDFWQRASFTLSYIRTSQTSVAVIVLPILNLNIVETVGVASVFGFVQVHDIVFIALLFRLTAADKAICEEFACK